MYEKSVVVCNALGAHARPCNAVVSVALRLECDIRVFSGDRSVNGRSIFDLMSLNMIHGDRVTIVADGDGEREAVEQIASVIESGFAQG